MRYLSVCSGIEAATIAWSTLNWHPVAFSEIEKFPRSVLAYHYPDVPCHGDFTTIGENDYGPIDLLVGGTPCQSFSVAGLRGGLTDDRGNLALEFIRLAQRKNPKWIVWENVPGVLSSNEGRDFGSFLGGLAECGYGFAFRVLDAQHYGTPQRRRRVFVVGCLGDWRSAAQVLFEPESLCGDITPRRKEAENPPGEVAKCLTARGAGGGNLDAETANFVVHGTQDPCVSDIAFCLGRNNGGENVIALAENTIGRQPQNGGNGDGFTVGGPMYTLNATGVHGIMYENHPSDSRIKETDISPTVTSRCGTGGGNTPYVQNNYSVRRLLPVECERLMGFPDGFTDIPKASDANRYKALGNSFAIPVVRWIGERIKMVEDESCKK